MQINRRAFLGGLVGGVVATAAVRTFPFRVFSFPTDLSIPKNFYQIQEEITKSITDSVMGMDVLFWRPSSEDYIEGRKKLWMSAVPQNVSGFEFKFTSYEDALNDGLLNQWLPQKS